MKENHSPPDAQKTAGLSWMIRWKQFRTLSPFGSSAVVTLGTNYILAAFGLITGSLAARLLSPQGRGELASIQNLYWSVSILAMLGLPEAALYFSVREPRKSGAILSTGLFFACLSTPIVFFLFYPVVPLLLAAQSPQVIATARWILLGLPLYVLLVVPTFAARGAGSSVRWNLLRLLPGAGWFVFLVGSWLVDNRDPVFIAWGYLGVLAISLIPAALLIRKIIPGPYTACREWTKPMLRYGLPQAAAGVPQTLKLRLDQLAIGALLPPYLLGLYVVSAAWSNAASLVLTAIGNVLCPKIAGTPIDSIERRHVLSEGVRAGVWAGILLTFVLISLTPFAIPILFGKEFSSAISVGCILVPAAVIAGLNVILEESLRGLGNTAGVFWAESTGLCSMAAFVLLLVGPLGVTGVAVAAVIGNATTSAVLVPHICRESGLRASELLVPRFADLRSIAGRFRSWWLILHGR